MAKSIMKFLANGSALLARKISRIMFFVLGVLFLFWDKFGQKWILFEFSGMKIILLITAVFMFIMWHDMKPGRL